MWGESAVSVDALKAGRGKLFDEGNFGMFIHWGLFSHLGGKWQGKTYYGIGEWIMNPNMAGIPVADYKKVAKEFNPSKFDAKAIAQLAKDAGMNYIIITSKHHDGFAMYNSPSSPFNIVNFTAFKRDPVKELSDACKKHDLKFGVYYSLGRDWHDPDVPTNWPVKAVRSNTWDFPDEDAKDFSKYFERKVKPQVTELISQYHPAILWFDTPELINQAQSCELKELIGKLDPKCIVNERIGNGFGDYKVLEQKGGDQIIPGCWETCLTMSKNWGYIKTDTTFKSPEKLVGLLVDAVSKGGNLLLNIGPTAEGIIRPQNLDRMSAIGKWLSVNGEAIYETRPWKVFGENADSSAYKALEGFKPEEKDAVFDGTPKDLVQDIRFTSKGNELFIIARSWKDKEVIVKSLSKQNNPIQSISLLGHKAKISWKQTALETKIELPKQALREIPVYVFKVKFAESAVLK